MQHLLKSRCGLDVHKSMVKACIAHGPLDKPPILEDDFDVVLANAQHIKNVQGRKTDGKDCQWIALLNR